MSRKYRWLFTLSRMTVPLSQHYPVMPGVANILIGETEKLGVGLIASNVCKGAEIFCKKRFTWLGVILVF